MAGFSSKLGQLVRPAGLPDLWVGGPATLGLMLLYILGEAISKTQDQPQEWAPSQLHEAPEASTGWTPMVCVQVQP